MDLHSKGRKMLDPDRVYKSVEIIVYMLVTVVFATFGLLLWEVYASVQ